MAEMLRDADSSPKHLSTVRRHIRICRTIRGAEFLRAAIEPAYQRLQATLVEKEKAVQAEEDAQDDLDLRRREAADLVRTTSERAKQFDRDMPGDKVFERLFPEGGFSDFITSNGSVSASTAGLFATRLQDLGTSHAMAALASEHEKRATAIDDATKAVESAVRVRKLAVAEDEIAQAALRKAYEDNALDARKKFGKVAAERLFPRIRRRIPEEETSTSGG